MIAPQLALSTDITDLTAYIDSDKWCAEQKMDGHRVLLVAPGQDMPPTALTRNGGLYSRTLPKAIQDFRFPPGQWVLDGELVATVVNGHTVTSTLWVFDVPVSPLGTDLPLWQRRVILETLLKGIKHPFKIVPQACTQADKLKLQAASHANNFEGLVLKKVDSRYVSGGRTADWLKAKYVVTADVVVLDVRDDGKESVRLGLYENNGNLVEVGRSSLIGKEKNGAISPGDVLEVRYLYAGANGRLYQPTILRKRHDKRPDECFASQLKHVNKTVMETL